MSLMSPRFANEPRLVKASENNPPLRQGEQGEAVAIVQRALVDLGFDMPITTAGGTKLPDGIFGSETARVVRQFQAANNLDADGVVGRNTLAVLERLSLARVATDKAQSAARASLPDAFADTYHKTIR